MTGLITVCIVLAVILLAVLYGITIGSLLSAEQSRAGDRWKQMGQILDRRAAEVASLEQNAPEPVDELLAAAGRAACAYQMAEKPEQAVPLAWELERCLKGLLDRPMQQDSKALAELKGRFYKEENQFRTLSAQYNEYTGRYNYLVENFPSSTAAALFHFCRMPQYGNPALKEGQKNE